MSLRSLLPVRGQVTTEGEITTPTDHPTGKVTISKKKSLFRGKGHHSQGNLTKKEVASSLRKTSTRSPRSLRKKRKKDDQGFNFYPPATSAESRRLRNTLTMSKTGKEIRELKEENRILIILNKNILTIQSSAGSLLHTQRALSTPI